MTSPSRRVIAKGDRYALDPGPYADQADAFLHALHMRGLSRHTLRAYAYDLALLLAWLTATGRVLEQLTPADFVDFIAEQRQRDAGPRSINRRLCTARLFLRFVVGSDCEQTRGASLPGPHYKGPGRDRDLGLHPLRRRSHLKLRVKVPSELVEPLSVQQVRSFLGSLCRYRDLAITYLMLLCGLRSAEVLSVRVSDVDLAGARLRVRGKGSRERDVPLPAVLIDLIARYLQLERLSATRSTRLFVVLQGQRRGRPMTTSGLRSLFRHRRRRPLLRNANAHRFRHTFGADMARSGVRLPVLQRLMGHADPKTTLLYINLPMSDLAAEYQRAITELDKRYGRN